MSYATGSGFTSTQPRLSHPSDENLSLPPQEAKTASWGPRLLGTPALPPQRRKPVAATPGSKDRFLGAPAAGDPGSSTPATKTCRWGPRLLRCDILVTASRRGF